MSIINYRIYSNVGWPQFEADPTNAEGQKKKKKQVYQNNGKWQQPQKANAIYYHCIPLATHIVPVHCRHRFTNTACLVPASCRELTLKKHWLNPHCMH